MATILKDVEINRLLAVPKPLPKGWRKRLRLRKVDFHLRRDLQVAVGKATFTIKCRMNPNDPLDFSVILTYQEEKGVEHRLLRCNGSHPSQHTNQWEKQNHITSHTFDPCFHIHRATERYQEGGLKADGYAEPTDMYSDYDSALEHFVTICGFVDPEPLVLQPDDLFGGLQ